MKTCIKCSIELPDDAVFCHKCGKKQIEEKRKSTKSRGNGTGTVYKHGNTWAAEITLGFREVDGIPRRVKKRKYGFRTKKEALEYLPMLRSQQRREKAITWQQLFDLWLPTHRAGDSTISGYKSAFKHFDKISYRKVQEIEIEDLQECLDNCKLGKRTQSVMKVLAGLLYKYAVPRDIAKLNLAQYMIVGGEAGEARESFTDEQIERIKQQIGKVPHAEYVYCMCYLGFRPSEFFALDVAAFDRVNHTLTGGAKTEAGKNRIVTISPKVLPYVEAAAGDRTSGPLFCNSKGEAYTDSKFPNTVFYPVLEAAGIENPIINGRHKYTPHSCRHTFATLMKRVDGADKDKLKLIGHANAEMLRYYQDVTVDDLRKITDQI